MTEHILHPPTTKRQPSSWAMLLSALLNLLFLALLIWVNHVWSEEAAKMAAQQQQTMEVDVVPPPPPQAQPQPPPKQAVAQQQPQPQPQPEKQPEKQPEQQQRDLGKPPPPQLLAAQIREKSLTDRKDAVNGALGESVAMLLGNGPIIQMRAKADPRSGPEGNLGPIGEELSQSEQDYVLSQILPYWKIDTHRPEGRGLVLEAIIEIRPDGTLMSPLNRDDPWNPAGVIGGYAEMARMGYSYRREAMEGFLLALRMSQPLKLPPGGKWPKWMKLRFAFDDL